MSKYGPMSEHGPQRKRRGPQAIKNTKMGWIEKALGWGYLMAVAAALAYGYYKFIAWAFAH